MLLGAVHSFVDREDQSVTRRSAGVTIGGSIFLLGSGVIFLRGFWHHDPLQLCDGLASLAITIGLLGLQWWARWIVLAMSGLRAVGCIIALSTLMYAFITSSKQSSQNLILFLGACSLYVALLGFYSWWLWLLTRPSVKAQFQRQT